MEKFIKEEKERAQKVAATLKQKQDDVELKNKLAAQMKKEKQEQTKKRNLEMAAKAGKKAEEMMEGNMDAYQ